MKAFVINRRSWHYRWAMAGRDSQPQDLCTYVRSVVVTAVVAVTVYGIIGVVIGLVVVGGIVALLWVLALVVQYPLALLSVPLVLVSAFVVAATIRGSEMGIYAAIRQAKRLGICPLIEYE